ncbi:MAG: hypothetical protein J0M25_14750 [Flavobacteriales bacterium]|nr:hypothetical protein [Flavobacteriales bacterium]
MKVDTIEITKEKIDRDNYLHFIADSLHKVKSDPYQGMALNRLKKDIKDAVDYYDFPELDLYSTSYPGDCSWYCAGKVKVKKASSTLENQKDSNYDAENVIDGSLKTAWIEGKSYYGEGETLELLVSDTSIDEIIIYGGYLKSKDLWRLNSRPKELLLSINDKEIGILCFKDICGKQSFSFPKYLINSNETVLVQLKVLSVYKGDKYSDTAITEIDFDGPDHH